MSVNKVILLGFTGKDPEIRSMNNGEEVASFSLATSQSWISKQTGERETKTEWHNITIFNKNLVNVVKQYVKKGSKLYIEGVLQTRKWTDNAGIDKYKTDIVLQGFNATLQLLDSKSTDASTNTNTTQESTQQTTNQTQENKEGDFVDDDIPF